jgi:hypothetical protein
VAAGQDTAAIEEIMAVRVAAGEDTAAIEEIMGNEGQAERQTQTNKDRQTDN